LPAMLGITCGRLRPAARWARLYHRSTRIPSPLLRHTLTDLDRIDPRPVRSGDEDVLLMSLHDPIMTDATHIDWMTATWSRTSVLPWTGCSGADGSTSRKGSLKGEVSTDQPIEIQPVEEPERPMRATIRYEAERREARTAGWDGEVGPSWRQAFPRWRPQRPASSARDRK
jgi:hypothetical protein